MKKVLSPYVSNKEKLEGLNEQTNLLKDLEINSANLVDIIIDAEEKYNIEIDPDDAEQISTVGSCIEIIIKKTDQNA